MLTIRSRTPRGALFRLVVLVALLVATTPGGSVANPQATGNGAADVYGTVLEAGSASPIENAVVTIWYFGHDGPGGPTWSETVYANAEGAYVFDDVPAGKDDEPRFSIQAYADGYATGNSENFAFNESTGPVEVPDIFLDPAELTVFGAVLDADTLDPVPGASVSLFAEEWGDSRHADDNGEFRFYGTPANLEFTVGVWAWGYDWNEWGPFEYDGVDPLDVGAFHLQQGTPTPHFNVNPHDHDIWGHEWQANVELQITVDPVGGEDQHGTTAHTDEHGDFHLWYSTTPVDLSPGDLVTVSHGDTVKTHIVTSLAITGVDVAADTVSGVAEPGTHVNVGIHLDDEWVNRDVVAEDGTWTADFSADYDIVPGTSGWSSQSDDEGDGTFANWHVADPHFNVNPHDNGIWGHEWQAHAEIDVSVDGSEGLADFTTHANEWGDFDLWDLDGYDIVAGDVVTVTDGVTIKVHVVTELGVTSIDEAADMVYGFAAPASQVRVDAHGTPYDGDASRFVQADGAGQWEADFSEPVGDEPWDQEYDIRSGTNGNIEQRDGDGDATWVPWRVVNPHFNVNPHDNGIWGHEWPEHVELDVSVDGSEGLANFTAHTNEWGDFDVDTQGYDIVAGDVVAVTDGVTLKEHVVTGLQVWEVDAASDTVSGYAEPGSDVWVNIHEEDGPQRWLTAHETTGEWTADFSAAVGDEPWEHAFDIVLGTHGNAEQFDSDNDGTVINWSIDNDPPEAADDHYQTEWNTTLTVHAPGVLENDFDADGDMLIAHLFALPMNGTVVLGSDGSFIYTPDFGFTGTDWFSYKAFDGMDHSGMATVTIEVTLPQLSTIEIQHDAAGVVFDRWVTGYSSAYSGGGYVYGQWTDTELSIRFSGTTVRWIGPMQPAYGMADIYVDGVLVASDVDCYAPAEDATLEAVIWESDELDGGPHTLTVRLTGNRNPASTGNVVVVDRFEVDGVDPGGGGVRFDERAGTFSGTWIDANNSTYYDTTYSYSRWTNASFTLEFEGTRVAWIGPMTPFYGTAEIWLDGSYVETVDAYRAYQGWRGRIWESETLTPGTHTLEIRPTGEKNPASTSANIVIDAIDVVP